MKKYIAPIIGAVIILVIFAISQFRDTQEKEKKQQVTLDILKAQKAEQTIIKNKLEIEKAEKLRAIEELKLRNEEIKQKNKELELKKIKQLQMAKEQKVEKEKELRRVKEQEIEKSKQLQRAKEKETKKEQTRCNDQLHQLKIQFAEATGILNDKDELKEILNLARIYIKKDICSKEDTAELKQLQKKCLEQL